MRPRYRTLKSSSYWFDDTIYVEIYSDHWLCIGRIQERRDSGTYQPVFVSGVGPVSLITDAVPTRRAATLAVIDSYTAYLENQPRGE